MNAHNTLVDVFQLRPCAREANKNIELYSFDIINERRALLNASASSSSECEACALRARRFFLHPRAVRWCSNSLGERTAGKSVRPTERASEQRTERCGVRQRQRARPLSNNNKKVAKNRRISSHWQDNARERCGSIGARMLLFRSCARHLLRLAPADRSQA